MLISKEVISEIKERTDIISIVGEYVHSLEKSGKNWTGLCPFHNDKNPSFSISQNYDIYKCFSCGESGDVIRFIEKIEGLDFTEAVTFLAKKCGIELSTEKGENDPSFKRKDELINFNERIIKLFQYFLLEKREGNSALGYLFNRKIKKNIIDIFRIGYAPKEYGRLENILKKKGFKKDFLIESGLFSKGNNGLKTLFFDRVIFPIYNYRNECIAFGGRTLNSEIKPKYINSPETAIYKKSFNLYGINLAKEHIQKEKKVFIVEGYVDVISCYKNGLKNVVAPCGTAITSGQIKLLSRYATEIVLLLDGDEAGLKGVGRALGETANIENINTKVLILPDGMDPDDYFKKYAINDFKEFEKTELSGFDFLVFYKSQNLDKNNYKSLIDILNYLFEYINLWENEVIRSSFIEKLSILLNIDKGMIKREFDSFKKRGKIFQKEDNKSKLSEKKENILDDISKREFDIIIFLVNVNDCDDIVKRCNLTKIFFSNEKIGKIFSDIFENESCEKKNFINIIDDDNFKNYISERLFDPELKVEEKARERRKTGKKEGKENRKEGRGKKKGKQEEERKKKERRSNRKKEKKKEVRRGR